MKIDLIEGNRVLALTDVAHVLIPGRGRDESGFGLSAPAAGRVIVARNLYELVVKPNGGRIVCSGYKSPADTKGTAWSPPDAPDEIFCGMPEADIMREKLISMGVRKQDVDVERHSIDTVTNFLRSELEGHFGDSRPVAIVAQAGHLKRMLAVIAPRTLRRSYLGVAVSEGGGARENPVARLVSALVLTRLPDGADRTIVMAERRAGRVWNLAHMLGMRQYY